MSWEKVNLKLTGVQLLQLLNTSQKKPESSTTMFSFQLKNEPHITYIIGLLNYRDYPNSIFINMTNIKVWRQNDTITTRK